MFWRTIPRTLANPEEVLRQLEDLERALRDEEVRVLTLGREIKEFTSLLERLEGEKREAEHQSMTSGHLLQQLDFEMARVTERMGVSQAELYRLAAERNKQESTISARQAETAALEQTRAQLEQQIAAAQESLGALRQRREDAAQASSNRVARVAALEERHRSANAVLGRIDSLFTEMNERLHDLASQIEAAAAEKLQREPENLQLGQQASDFEAERNAGQAGGGAGLYSEEGNEQALRRRHVRVHQNAYGLSSAHGPEQAAGEVVLVQNAIAVAQ